MRNGKGKSAELGEIRGDALYPWAVACARLGWCDDAARKMIGRGLRPVKCGRSYYIKGSTVIEFFERLATLDIKSETP